MSDTGEQGSLWRDGRNISRDTALSPEEKRVDRKARTRIVVGLFIGVIKYLESAGCDVIPSADREKMTLVSPEGTLVSGCPSEIA